MLKPWEVIAELEADNSRLAKEAVVKREAQAGNDEFFKGARYALDCMITFGVKQVAEKSGNGKGLTPETFWDVANKLANRALTGNMAQTAVNYLRMDATEQEWNQWYRRILIKDLRCGVSEKTINKQVGKVNASYTVPVFSCQLAHDGANHEGKVAGKKLIEVKLDGVRVITIVHPNGIVNQYSRNGKELVNFEHIKAQFAKHAKLVGRPMVFDGEVMSSSFQDLMKQVHRKSDVAAGDAVLNLFDVIPLEDFVAGRCEVTQIDRSNSLKLWYDPVKDHMPNVTVVGQELVDLNTADGAARFKEINQQAINGGYEGIMIKDPNAPYVLERDVAWLKQKPFIEVTLKATAIEEGTGKNEGRMGAVFFTGEDDGKVISVSVGGGWSDQQRAQIWADYTGKPAIWQKRIKGKLTTIIEQPTGKSIIGQFGEVRADAVTRNQDGTYSLRFPRFKTFRGFAPGEKL